MTDQRIIFPSDDGGVCVLIPTPEWLAQEGNTLEALVATAHEVCPYSNATRGNLDVKLSVV